MKRPQWALGAPCTGSCSPSTTPESRMLAIDRLEGFRPGGSSLYRRVLVPATVNGARELAWVYTVEVIHIKRRRIVSGCWPE